MMDDDSSSTLIGRDVQAQRVFQVYEVLRAELEPFLHPKMLTSVLDLAADSVSNQPSDDVLREMRAAVAGMLLDRVGQFLVSTQPEVGARPTLPTRARALHA
jgi:hypothetical protein